MSSDKRLPARFVVIPILAIALLVDAGALLPSTADAAETYQTKLLQLHNRERVRNNLPRLRFSVALNRAAEDYAEVMDLNDHFDHTGPAPDYKTFDQRIIEAGGTNFMTMGENIASGQRTPSQVTRAWMNSPGHRRNILRRQFRYVGFGRAGSEPYWATSFGG